MIITEGEDSSAIATTLMLLIFHTGSFRMKQYEMHLLSEKASNSGEVHPENWSQIPLRMDQEAGCPCYNFKWDSDSLLTLPCYTAAITNLLQNQA